MAKSSVVSGLLAPVRSAASWVIFVVVIVLLLGSAVGPRLMQWAHRAWENVTARVTTIVSPGPVIVERLQALNRLETVRQVSRQVVEARTERPQLPAFLGKDRLMMMVQTEAVAGIDLSRLTENDVRVRERAVSLRLPPPQIFSVSIDDANSKVYSRERGWLVVNPDTDLERKARLKALADARRIARQEALGAARANAEINLRGLLGSMGFEEIDIQWADRAA